MRLIRWTAPLLFSTLAWSATAHASPYSFVLEFEPVSNMDPTANTVAAEGPQTGEVDDAGTPESMDPTADSDGEGDGGEGTEGTDDGEGGADGVRDPSKFNRHAIGVRTGLVLTPTWGLSGFLASHTNSLCRGTTVGNFASDRGLTKTEGCNFYVGAEYTYRKSRVVDIVTNVGYRTVKTPDGYWLDKDECPDGDGPGCDLAASDYTEVNLSYVFMGVDFIARAPLVVTPDVEFGIGGGAGLGLGIIVGDGVYQTPMGAGSVSAGTCNSIEDLGDLTKCTPGYVANNEGAADPADAEAGWSDPARWNAPGQLATCSKDECNTSDLELIGRIKNKDIPPVVPVLNVIASMRLLVKDVWALDVRGGWKTIGWFFGGSMSYHFGGGKADVKE